MSKKEVFGSVIGGVALMMAFMFYDWKLALIIFLAIFGNNLERSK